MFCILSICRDRIYDVNYFGSPILFFFWYLKYLWTFLTIAVVMYIFVSQLKLSFIILINTLLLATSYYFVKIIKLRFIVSISLLKMCLILFCYRY